MRHITVKIAGRDVEACPCGVCWSKWPRGNVSAQLPDGDNNHVKIDSEEAFRELMELVEPNDELPPEAHTTEGYMAYLRSFLKKE